RKVSFRVEQGTFAAIVGRNGAGKTTLMRAILNLIPASGGRIEIGGTDTTRMRASMHAHQGVGYMPEGRRLVPDWTVRENILLPAWSTRLRDPDLRLEEIYQLIPQLRRFSERKALALSGGQQKLVALARALIVGEKLLLLDEPFEGVAPALVLEMAEIF